eukprot:scaffold316016_cov22-Tisochrysis_lutea.AAC.1
MAWLVACKNQTLTSRLPVCFLWICNHVSTHGALQVLYDVAGEDPTREDVLDQVTRNKDACVSGLQQVRTWLALRAPPNARMAINLYDLMLSEEASSTRMEHFRLEGLFITGGILDDLVQVTLCDTCTYLLPPVGKENLFRSHDIVGAGVRHCMGARG